MVHRYQFSALGFHICRRVGEAGVNCLVYQRQHGKDKYIPVVNSKLSSRQSHPTRASRSLSESSKLIYRVKKPGPVWIPYRCWHRVCPFPTFLSILARTSPHSVECKRLESLAQRRSLRFETLEIGGSLRNCWVALYCGGFYCAGRNKGLNNWPARIQGPEFLITKSPMSGWL